MEFALVRPLLGIVTKAVELALRRTPIFIDLHKGFKEDFLRKKLLECLARLGIHLFQRHPLVPNDDALLAVALHIDDGVDADCGLCLLELLHTHLYAVRNFLVVIEQNLLANDFTHEEFGGLIGELFLVEIGGRLRQKLLDALQQNVDAKLILGRKGQYLGVG